MNILILDSHLKEFLDTKANAQKIGELLALCGPSVERVTKFGTDWLYDIEITTNRIDTASVIGIAREAASILSFAGIKANLKLPENEIKLPAVVKPVPLLIKTDSKLNKRVMAIVMEVKQAQSPKWLKDRLEAAGIRSLNNLIDITNYVMLEIGHPTHVFDYDKITDNKLIFKLSKKGEKITTLDNKTYALLGNDIVITDSKGEIIDLPGVMGTKNSVVDSSTKRIIFFIDNNDPQLMRKTSLALDIRTLAVQLNEKNVDPELAQLAFAKGVSLYQKLAAGKILSKAIDIYPKAYKPKTVTISLEQMNSKLGIEVTETQVKQILGSLGFDISIDKKTKNINAIVPSFRASDVEIPEDLVEEVARVYGYHNLPSVLMTGALPTKPLNSPFEFERKVKQLISGWGGVEIYNYSLVSKKLAGENALELKNPLGSDTQFLRTTLMPSVISAAKQNGGVKDPVHLFEMANVYLPRDNDLPEERITLGGVMVNHDYRKAKGVIESLLEKLNIKFSQNQKDLRGFAQNRSIEIISNDEIIGSFGQTKSGEIYYEFDMETLQRHYKAFVAYIPNAKFPAQIEDITFVLPTETHINKVLHSIKVVETVSKVELSDIYKDSFTFRIWYQDKKKTLTDKEVEKTREKIIKSISKAFNATVKG